MYILAKIITFINGLLEKTLMVNLCVMVYVVYVIRTDASCDSETVVLE